MAVGRTKTLKRAHRLNEEGVRSPRSRGWAPSGIREMLYRGAYRGEVTWGKLQKVTRKGTKRQQHRPQTDWLTVSMPAQRIIPDRLVDALADGSLPQEDLRARLSAETSRRRALQAELQRLDAIGQVAAMNVEKLTRRINAKVRDIVSVLGRQTPQARQMLRKLLTEKIDLEPVGSGRARGYKFRGSLAIDRLISGEAIGTHLTVVAPTGFAPVF